MIDNDTLQGLLLLIGFIVAAGCVTGIILTWLKRRPVKGIPADLTARLDDIANRLAHLEASVDASAVEIERIAEGQRFTAKLLAGREPSELSR